MLQTGDIIWALLFIGTAATLQVNIIPAQGEISVGESKFFLCEAIGDVKEIDWFSPSGEKILPNRQDISVTRNDDSSTLTIYKANIDNAGIYKCVAKDGNMETQATVTVKIYQKLTFESAPSPQEFNEGETANIVCDVVSSPPPTIIWKRGSGKIQMDKDVRFKVLDGNHLQIRGIKKTDEDDYVCEGRIMARGEIDFKIIKVVVNVLPTIRTRQAEVNATADVGQSIMLACDADGYPEPTVTWARNNIVLESGDKYSINDDGSELLIKHVRKVDEGDYACIAKNKAGVKTEEVSLNVFVQPKITYLKNQTASELEEQITLTCEASGDPTPSIVWSFGRRVFNEGEQASWTRPETHKSLDDNVEVRSHARVSSLTLKYVQFTDAGQYLCTARNPIGQDAQAMYLEVRYAPKVQGKVTVYTWEGNPANISCEVLAHPEASVTWFRDSQQLPGPNTTNIKIFNTPEASHLEVTPDSQTDFGSYNCTATNAVGTESKEFLLIQAEVPSAPFIEQVVPYSSTAVVHFDEPDATGGVPVLKYRVEWRLLNQGNWTSRKYTSDDGINTITITGLKPVTSYEVKMSAINGKGEGESSAPKDFRTEPVRYSFTMTSKNPLERRHVFILANVDGKARNFTRRIRNINWRSQFGLPRAVVGDDGGEGIPEDENESSMTSSLGEMGTVDNTVERGSHNITNKDFPSHVSKVSSELPKDSMEQTQGQLPETTAPEFQSNTTVLVPSVTLVSDPKESKIFTQLMAEVSAPVSDGAWNVTIVQTTDGTAVTETTDEGIATTDTTDGWITATKTTDWDMDTTETTDVYIDVTEPTLWATETIFTTDVPPSRLPTINMARAAPVDMARDFWAIPSVTPAPISPSTAPSREPNPPKLEGKLQSTGNVLKVNWIKQDDGGSPIKHYLVRYKAKHVSDWKPEIRLPSNSEHVVLSGLDWNTEYEVHVVAENQQGKSKAGTFSFRTLAEPTAIPDPMINGSSLSTGAIVGILVVIFLLLLVAVDITCYFLNKCGLLMCIAVNFCGKPGPSSKNKDIEEGKAAFTKDESKEPIVEVRTEEERTPNHEGGGQVEPNETTPLTEPELAADATATVVDLLPSVTTNSDSVTTQNSPASESTTLTSSTAAAPPAADAKATPPVPQSSTPKSSTAAPAPPTATPAEAAPKVAPLVDLSDAPVTKAPGGTETADAVGNHTPASEPSPAPATQPTKAEAPKPPGSEPPRSDPKSPPVPVPNATAPDNAVKPSQHQDFQIDGGPLQPSDTDLAKDVFDALGKPPGPPADSSAVPTAALDEKMVPADNKSKPEETDVKKTPSEVKTDPNEAAQTNGDEVKA
ncbi:neural cell adhesion molecule 1a isoform X3 [Paramormyrops kingsleyae]|uniref:neural cell adhesion molecule 1a isoform X3 n=1 Tax=Paramormyrops kingsleyae TaxID=1676925 RepID=UPI003B96B7D6